MAIRPPPRNGVVASNLQLPPGPWATIFDGLCAHFGAISRDTWRERIARGRVLDEQGAPITEATPYRVGLCVHYYREVVDEPRIPFIEDILHVDEHLIVVDKPHFLPVTPAGGYVEETLLARLLRRLGNTDLAPLHRIDRTTAGLVLFSVNAGTRARYQALFRDRLITKRYEALAPALPWLEFPLVRATRLVRGEPFFRMQEVAGGPNSETRIDALTRDGDVWRYVLVPLTGRKHQLRVHMAAIGAAIVNDELYPQLAMRNARERRDDDYSRPLKLLAKTLAFIDPITGRERHFESRRNLQIR
jgi:tRNA pseudouridine32 synthase/23S rRNA pseudouridine746 synthase